MRLVRNNDDPKLIADLERLAGGGAVSPVTPPGVLESDIERLAASRVSSGPNVPIDDPFVRRFVQGSIHLRKYAPFYAGAGLWLGAMLLIQPVGGGGSAIADVAQPTGVRRADITPAAALIPQAEPDVAASPVFFSSGASSFSSDDVAASSDFSDSSDFPEPTPEASSEFAFEDDTETFESDEFESFEDEEAVPDPLAIIESGYASSAGGTPLEQAPSGGGLPITTAGGNTTKYSFVRLSGDETTISLQEAADGNVNSATATLKMCPLTTSTWTGGPGKAMSAAPAFDASYCASGTRSSTGVWLFDLGDFTPIEGSNGFAIVPGTGTASTFQVVLKPSAVVVESAGDGA